MGRGGLSSQELRTKLLLADALQIRMGFVCTCSGWSLAAQQSCPQVWPSSIPKVPPLCCCICGQRLEVQTTVGSVQYSLTVLYDQRLSRPVDTPSTVPYLPLRSGLAPRTLRSAPAPQRHAARPVGTPNGTQPNATDLAFHMPWQLLARQGTVPYLQWSTLLWPRRTLASCFDYNSSQQTNSPRNRPAVSIVIPQRSRYTRRKD